MSLSGHGMAVAESSCGLRWRLRSRATNRLSSEEGFMRSQAHRLVLAASVLAATMVMMVAVPAPGRAGVDADVRAGVFTGADAVGVGAGVLTPIGDRNYRWYANPNAEIAVGDRD